MGNLIDTVDNSLRAVSVAVEIFGVAVIVAGLFWASYSAWRHRKDSEQYTKFRRHVGRSLLLGLEILVAADIIVTAALELTLARVAALGLLIFVRTFLSWALEVEIEGRWPWKGMENE